MTPVPNGSFWEQKAVTHKSHHSRQRGTVFTPQCVEEEQDVGKILLTAVCVGGKGFDSD